jgi:hypothetical protein
MPGSRKSLDDEMKLRSMSRVRLFFLQQIERLFRLWRACRAPALTVEEIREWPDDDVVHELYCSVCNRVGFDLTKKDNDCSWLNPSEAAVWYLWNLDCEVVNGGFNQYFFNKRQRSTEAVARAHDVVGALEHKALFLEAVADLEHVRAAHQEASSSAGGRAKDLFAAFAESYQDNPLKDLDTAYYHLKPGMEEILCRYVRANPEAFARKRG